MTRVSNSVVNLLINLAFNYVLINDHLWKFNEMRYNTKFFGLHKWGRRQTVFILLYFYIFIFIIINTKGYCLLRLLTKALKITFVKLVTKMVSTFPMFPGREFVYEPSTTCAEIKKMFNLKKICWTIYFGIT